MTKPKKSNKKDYLHIALKKNNITKAVDNYCAAMDVNPKDIGFHMGHIVGTSKELEEPLGVLMQIHFFAGIYHAMTKKGDIVFKNLNKKEWEELKETKIRKEQPPEANINYVG